MPQGDEDEKQGQRDQNLQQKHKWTSSLQGPVLPEKDQELVHETHAGWLSGSLVGPGILKLIRQLHVS